MLTNYDKKIIELSLQGYSSREIADRLPGSSESSIINFISNLNKVNSPNYNPNIYSRILMEKSLKINNIVDKDLIYKVAEMILDNYLPIEIAVLNNITEPEFKQIIYNIKSLTYFDKDMVEKIKQKLHNITTLKPNIKFRRILKLEKQFPNIKLEDYGFELIHYRRWQENIRLIEDFLENNLDITTLALKHNVVNTTARILLNNTDHFLENNFDQETCQRVISMYYSKINETNKRTEFQTKKIVDPKIHSIVKNGRFWILFLLTFKISISDLAKMFKIDDVKELHERLFRKAEEINNIYYRALKYLDYTSSSENLQTAINFYKEYMEAKKNDLEKAKKMIKNIDDQDFITLVKSKKRIDRMTEEEHRLIADNWAKFALSSRDFPYQLSSLDKYCLPYNEDEIKKVKDFNLETSRMSQRLVCQKINRGYHGR